MNDKTSKSKRKSENYFDVISALATLSSEVIFSGSSLITLNIDEIFSKKKRDLRRKRLQESKVKLLIELQKEGVDPSAFEDHLNNEINRRLKKKYGAWFFVFTFVFTTGSYTIIILNSIQNWGISDAAITALIIETPIQFVGILYIIAKNLFPEKGLEP